MAISASSVKELARVCGFELTGVAPALPAEDFARFEAWRAAGMAGEMRYLTDHRGDLRGDPRNLLPTAKSIVCLGKIYNTDYPRSTNFSEPAHGWISRYAWGDDYHEVLRPKLERLIALIVEEHGEPFASRICIDTAPLLERSYARLAGLGWIGKNTCLINQERGSWIFLAEILLSIPLEFDAPPPNRCGTCTRCIDACPTDAIIPDNDGGWRLDARSCISYLTIERRGEIPAELAEQTANHVFGCDICQDVCPWNRRADVTQEESFAPRSFASSLADLAHLTEHEFRAEFRHTPVWRARYSGFLRNVASAMGNSGKQEMMEPLARLASHPDALVANAARQAIVCLKETD